MTIPLPCQCPDCPDPDPGVDPADDPSTPQLRVSMARGLLIRALVHYEETLSAADSFHAAYPNLSRPVAPGSTEVEQQERQAWRRLRNQVDAEFDAAELTLASLLQSLYDDLAPEGKKAGSGSFVVRAVRFAGTTYALQYDVAYHEPGSNIVAIVRDDVAFDLVEGPSDEDW